MQYTLRILFCSGGLYRACMRRNNGFGYLGFVIWIAVFAILVGVTISAFFKRSSTLYREGGVESVLDEARGVSDLSDERNRELRRELDK